MRYICSSSGYVYDPAIGDPAGEVPAGTPFEDFPDSWCCLLCYLGKEVFDLLD